MKIRFPAKTLDSAALAIVHPAPKKAKTYNPYHCGLKANAAIDSIVIITAIAISDK